MSEGIADSESNRLSPELTKVVEEHAQLLKDMHDSGFSTPEWTEKREVLRQFRNNNDPQIKEIVKIQEENETLYSDSGEEIKHRIVTDDPTMLGYTK